MCADTEEWRRALVTRSLDCRLRSFRIHFTMCLGQEARRSRGVRTIYFYALISIRATIKSRNFKKAPSFNLKSWPWFNVEPDVIYNHQYDQWCAPIQMASCDSDQTDSREYRRACSKPIALRWADSNTANTLDWRVARLHVSGLYQGQKWGYGVPSLTSWYYWWTFDFPPHREPLQSPVSVCPFNFNLLLWKRQHFVDLYSEVSYQLLFLKTYLAIGFALEVKQLKHW